MRFGVELQPTAARDLERECARLSDLVREGELRSGYPEDWFDDVEDALYSLEELPLRCPLAPEAAKFRRPLRHRILDNGYRIIFEVRDDTVWILHIRHQRRMPLEPPAG